MNTFTVGYGRTALHYWVELRGTDIYVHIDGGASHLGSVSMAEKDFLQTTSFSGHEEHQLTEPVAKRLAAVFSCRVVVSGGVHLDDIEKEEIMLIVAENEATVDELISVLREMR